MSGIKTTAQLISLESILQHLAARFNDHSRAAARLLSIEAWNDVLDED
ncbi:MAG: hypothetical protein ACRDF4_10520 [Rhabdochlamydiaceae bacterium]